MLIEFKVENYRSFRDQQLFSLVAGRDNNHPGNLIPSAGFSVAKVAAIYGPNASGKSNLIKALSAVQRFVLASATKMNLGDRIDVSPFRLDAEMRNKSSRFEMTIVVEGTTYVYGFSATPDRVHDEWLSVRKPGGRLSQWVERRFDSETEKTTWQLKGPIKSDAELLKAKTRDNGLLLSRGAELNIEPLSPLFLWFRKNLQILDLSIPPIHLAQETARRMDRNAELRARIVELIRDADFGIGGIDVSEAPAFPPLPEDTPDVLREFYSNVQTGLKTHTSKNDLTKFSVTTEHAQHETGETIRFNLEEDESNGTQRFFAVAGPILDALQNGHVLVIDELDCSMHPKLTRKLIELFQSSEWNSTGAQLIFATHDSSLMQSSLFRRDQIWLTEKRRDGSTDLFSLHDIDSENRPRSSESLEKNYLAGRYGAVPNFGPTLEDLEVQ